MEKSKVYLGDGVYASFDGFHIVLSTQAGHQIFIESDVFVNMLKFAEKQLGLKITAESVE